MWIGSSLNGREGGEKLTYRKKKIPCIRINSIWEDKKEEKCFSEGLTEYKKWEKYASTLSAVLRFGRMDGATFR